VGSRAGLDFWRRVRPLGPVRIQSPDHPARIPVTIPTMLPRNVTFTVLKCFKSTYTLLYCACLHQDSDYGALTDVMQFGTHAETFRRNLRSLSSGHTSVIKIEAASFSETLVPSYQTLMCHISEDYKLSILRSGDLIRYTVMCRLTKRILS
jgi:hypothetical protein